MPILELGEVMGAGRKPVDLPKEGKLPVICVFDPIAVHSVIFDHILAGLRDKVGILWQAGFSRTWIEVGGIDEWTHSGLIAVKRPVLLVSELEVIPGEGYNWGIEMLQNFRRTAGLGDVPLIIISNANCLLRAHGGAGNELGKLRVNQFFAWADLEKESKEQERLFDFVSQILGLKTEP